VQLSVVPALQSPTTNVLILSAGVGQGHQSAAEGLRDELRRMAPDVGVTLHNGLGRSSGPLRTFLERFTRWQLTHWPSTYSLSYALGVRWGLGRRIALRLLYRASRTRLAALIDAERPDVVVSTYPGITAPLGVMRERGELDVPVCALITDLASLHFWAHPAADLHLASYRESLEEIAAITDGAPARAIRPPLGAAHWARRGRSGARRALGLDPELPLVVVSGGGWGVGDLRGAIEAALRLERPQVVVVCGGNEPATRRLRSYYSAHSRVRVLGYTHAMADLLGAADVLVHSTGGMTCLEAAVQGCPVIAYGFARGHVRHNVQAMVRHGLIRRARSSHELTAQIGEALGCADALVSYLEDRPCASSALLEMLAPRTSLKEVLVGQFDADADGAGMTHVELGPATRRAVH
jgi:UDP-N-acetylglucosamine:LPS N-acetylglucosamine transferase